MSMIEKLTPDMIATFVADNALTAYHDANHEYLVPFCASRPGRTGEQVTVKAEGRNGQILGVRISTDTVHDISDKSLLEVLCNEWNRDNRWPKVYVLDRSNGTIEVVAEGHLDVTGVGIHQALVNSYCRTVICAAFDFFDWLTEQQAQHDKMRRAIDSVRDVGDQE